ncbi:MAG: hypothetical protein NC489_28695 [Ruminococcus flavefaciens]|nr:hypothetical protein [Ruminococcus flavefaciens]
MAILKQRLSKRMPDGSLTPVHLETSSDLVLRPDGTTAEANFITLEDGFNSAMETVETVVSDLSGIKDQITDTPRYKNLVLYSRDSHDNVMDGGYNGYSGDDLGSESIIAGYNNRFSTPGAHILGHSNTISGRTFIYGNGNHTFTYGYENNTIIGNNNFIGANKSVICGDANMVVSDTCVFRTTTELLSGTPMGNDAFVKDALFAVNIVDLGDELNITDYMTSVMAAIESAYNADKLYLIADSGSYPNIAKYVTKSWMTVDKDNNRILVQLPEGRTTTKTWRIQGGIAVNNTGKPEGVLTFGQYNLVPTSNATAIGYGLVANWEYQVVLGTLNVPGERKHLGSGNPPKLIIGKGTDNRYTVNATDPNPFPGGDGVARANCFRVTDVGVYASGNYNATGADYAEMFEWADANPDGEDRAGRFVTLDGDKIRLATSTDDFILGVVSGNPSIVGDVHDDQWQGMYLYDIYGRPLFETVEIPEWSEEVLDDPTDPESGTHTVVHPAHTETRQKLNPEYNSTEKYQPRSSRPEWAAVGLMGKLVVNDDGTAVINGYVTVADGGIATNAPTKTKYRVMKRLDDTHVQIMILP